MTEEAQPLATNLQSTASTAPSSRPQTSGSPDPITDTSPATPPTTSTAPAELTGTENSLQAKDKEPLMDLEHFDWASLEQHYHADMRTCAATEASLSEEFNQAIRVSQLPYIPPSSPLPHINHLQIFESWASVTTSHENERSLKR